MKKWSAGCGIAAFITGMLAIAVGYCSYVKVKSWAKRKIAKIESREALITAPGAQRRIYLESRLSPEIRRTIPPDFYTYPGFRDWYRVPLVFPYQLQCIDTQQVARLCSHKPGFPVADPNQSSADVLDGITALSTDDAMLVFRIGEGAAASYGILQYQSGDRSEFKSEAEMWTAARALEYSGDRRLVKVADFFGAYYDYAQDPFADFRHKHR